MDEEKKEFKSLFDAVSHVEAKRQREERREQEQKPPAQGDTDEMVLRMKKMHEEISLGLEHAFRFGDVTPSQFRKYISTPQNFSKQEWDDIQKQKETNDSMILALRKKMQYETPPKVAHSLEEKDREEPKKKIKKKAPTTTRRSWLDMH